MVAIPKITVTPEEYLAWERTASYKSEYLDGDIYAMAGASEEHVLIMLNLTSHLKEQLQHSGQSCKTYAADMRVKVSSRAYVYPDVAVVCGGARFDAEKPANLLNPVVIIEILSDTTEAYDRGRKFRQYQTIPTVRDYLLVSQDKALVEHYSRQGNRKWTLTTTSELDGEVELTAIDCTLQINAIYEGVDLPSKSET